MNFAYKSPAAFQENSLQPIIDIRESVFPENQFLQLGGTGDSNLQVERKTHPQDAENGEETEAYMMRCLHGRHFLLSLFPCVDFTINGSR